MAEKKKRAQLLLYMSHEMKKQVAEKARELGVSSTSLFIIAMDQWLKQNAVVDMSVMFKTIMDGKVTPEQVKALSEAFNAEVEDEGEEE